MSALLAIGSGSFIYVKKCKHNLWFYCGPQTIPLIQNIVWRFWVLLQESLRTRKAVSVLVLVFWSLS